MHSLRIGIENVASAGSGGREKSYIACTQRENVCCIYMYIVSFFTYRSASIRLLIQYHIKSTLCTYVHVQLSCFGVEHSRIQCCTCIHVHGSNRASTMYTFTILENVVKYMYSTHASPFSLSTIHTTSSSTE